MFVSCSNLKKVTVSIASQSSNVFRLLLFFISSVEASVTDKSNALHVPWRIYGVWCHCTLVQFVFINTTNFPPQPSLKILMFFYLFFYVQMENAHRNRWMEIHFLNYLFHITHSHLCLVYPHDLHLPFNPVNLWLAIVLLSPRVYDRLKASPAHRPLLTMLIKMNNLYSGKFPVSLNTANLLVWTGSKENPTRDQLN